MSLPVGDNRAMRNLGRKAVCFFIVAAVSGCGWAEWPPKPIAFPKYGGKPPESKAVRDGARARPSTIKVASGDTVYKVARRYQLHVTLVANSWMKHPTAEWLTMQVVEEQFDGADDWIVEHAGRDDIVIASDIPLADRCLKKGARVLGHRGRPFRALIHICRCPRPTLTTPRACPHP